MRSPTHHRLRIGIALFAWLSLASPLLWATDWHHTLRPGESLAQVAVQCCGNASFADRISQYNNLDQRFPAPVGARLRIPVAWLLQQPANAQLISVTGQVLDSRGRQWNVGDQISIGQQITTAADSLALIRFADNSTLLVNPDALVTFDVLSVFGDAGMVDTLIRFERGRGELKIIKSQQNRMRVSTPTGIAAVRGTEFRVAAGQAGTPSLVETTEGLVGFVPPGSGALVTLVDAGFGVIAANSGVTKEALLPAPGPLVAPSVPSHNATLSWPKLAGATGYQVQVFRLTNGALQPVRIELVKRTRYQLADLVPATYQVQVRAVAASGLQGMDLSLIHI